MIFKSQCWFLPLFIGDPSFKKTLTMAQRTSPRRVIRQIIEHDQGEFCLFDSETYENGGFQRTKLDIKRENRREIQWRNVIYGTQKSTRSIIASEGKNMSNCDRFVHHLQR